MIAKLERLPRAHLSIVEYDKKNPSARICERNEYRLKTYHNSHQFLFANYRSHNRCLFEVDVRRLSNRLCRLAQRTMSHVF